MSDVKAKLHSEALQMVEYLESQGKDRYAGKSIEDIRKNHSLSSQSLNGSVDYKGKSIDIVIPSQVPDGLPASVYVPENAPQDATIWVYFHGGGMTLGSRVTCEAACKIISMQAGVIVVNVEYRLAPEYKFPCQIDDGCAAAKWVLENKTTVGGTEKSLVGIGGDSAGGTISASVCHDVQGLDFQVLIYPRVIEARKNDVVQSQRKFVDGPLLTEQLIIWFENQYVPAGCEQDPRLAAALRPTFSQLPPALIVVAEIDPLRDEADVYEKLLKDAGVPCEVFEVKGVLHAFFTQPGLYKTTTPPAYDKVVSFMKSLKK